MAQLLRVLARNSLPTATRSLSTTSAAQNAFAGDILSDQGPVPQPHRDQRYPALGK